MSTKLKFFILLAIFSAVAIASITFLFVADIAVLNPKGAVGEKEKDLLFISTILMLIVVIPVFILTFVIGWKYRAEAGAKHTPDWDHSFLAECIWWGIPFAIAAIIGVFTWIGCHQLDPFRPLEAEREMKVQVIALRWKWLFIYPEEKIASLNFLKIPEKTSIHFEITSDAPMNSFWIPKLGGQVYAMPAMRSELYLIANEPGEFRGSSANISGKGFASMTFQTVATSSEEFASWVESVKSSPNALDQEEYQKLLVPSEYNPPVLYTLATEDLFDKSITKYTKNESK